MKSFLFNKALAVAFAVAGFSWSVQSASYDQLVDDNATGETRQLYTNLKNLSKNVFLFGHQNTTTQGLTFSGANANKSDVKTAVGKFPAVYGYDFAAGAPIAQYSSHVQSAYNRGGVVTISWHVKNPATGGNYNDTTGNPVQGILAGGAAYNTYIDGLDNIADFANQAGVPIIFRPLHENTGGWFWWGSDTCSASEFRALWQLTVEYLRDTRGVRNFLYAYSPSRGVYDSRYPGDDYVDIIGGDMYDYGNFSNDLKTMARNLVNLADAKGKVAAITEVGPRNGLSDPNADNEFYTKVLLNTLKNDATARRVAFALVWRNGSSSHHWVPVSGDASFSDFGTFFNDKYTIFEASTPDMYAPASTSTRGWPYCSAAISDPDGDGWGWENATSCVMIGGAADLSSGQAVGSYNYCTLGAVDPDGDGWGWQSNKSCVVPGSPADPDANW